MTTAIHPIAPAPARTPRIRVPKLFSLAGFSPPSAAGRVEDLHFVEFGGFSRLLDRFYRTFGGITLMSPVAVRGQAADAITSTALIGQAMGFGDEHCQRLLHHHHDRRLRRWQITDALQMLIMLPLMSFVQFPLVDLVPDPFEVAHWTASTLVGLAVSAIMAACVFMLLLVQVTIFARVSQLLVNRYFGESLCPVQALYLLVELHREDVLARADRRRQLVTRFDDLARTTRLLGLRYASRDPASRMRLQRHFREVARSIAELRMWAVTPMEGTLDDLRREVRNLTRIFIMGTYGELKWRPDAEDEPAGGWKPILRSAARTIALLLPFAALGCLLLSAQAQQTFGGTPVVVFLVAWALISVDSALQMGIVSGAVSLAKSIKELR